MSKFSKLFEPPPPKAKTRGVKVGRRLRPAPKPSARGDQSPEPPPLPIEAPKRGRPPAKHSDPDYVQATAYIKRETHREVKIALLREPRQREFSELIEELLAEWLKAKK